MIASSGTWGSIGCGFLVTLGVCRRLDGLEQRRSVARVGNCSWPPPNDFLRGSCAFPGGAPKATLVDCAWLVDPHLVLVVRHPIVG